MNSTLQSFGLYVQVIAFYKASENGYTTRLKDLLNNDPDSEFKEFLQKTYPLDEEHPFKFDFFSMLHDDIQFFKELIDLKIHPQVVQDVWIDNEANEVVKENELYSATVFKLCFAVTPDVKQYIAIRNQERSLVINEILNGVKKEERTDLNRPMDFQYVNALNVFKYLMSKHLDALQSRYSNQWKALAILLCIASSILNATTAATSDDPNWIKLIAEAFYMSFLTLQLLLMEVYHGRCSFATSMLYNGVVMEAKNRTLNDIQTFLSMKAEDRALPCVNFTNIKAITSFQELTNITLQFYATSIVKYLNMSVITIVFTWVRFVFKGGSILSGGFETVVWVLIFVDVCAPQIYAAVKINSFFDKFKDNLRQISDIILKIRKFKKDYFDSNAVLDNPNFANTVQLFRNELYFDPTLDLDAQMGVILKQIEYSVTVLDKQKIDNLFYLFGSIPLNETLFQRGTKYVVLYGSPLIYVIVFDILRALNLME